MINTTQHLNPKKKDKLFLTHFDLSHMIFTFGNIMLREQIKDLYHQISGKSKFETEFEISDLIKNGMLIGKKICRTSPTEILFLNKFCTSRLEGKTSSKTASSPSFTNTKIFESIFKIEFLINKIVPEMKQQNFEITTDNIVVYLNWSCNTLLSSPNQYTIPGVYDLVFNKYNQELAFNEDFFTDWKCAIAEQALWQKNNSNSMPDPENIPYLSIKEQRDTIRDSYKSETDKMKQFYNLSNFIYSRFNIAGIEGNTIKIYYFDLLNQLTIEKLYRNKLVYTLMLFKRYLNSDIKIDVTVYLHNEDRKNQLLKDEQKPVFDGLTSNYKSNNRLEAFYQNTGLLPSYWKDITVTYKIMDICNKYNLTI